MAHKLLPLAIVISTSLGVGCTNPVQRENALPGSNEWEITNPVTMTNWVDLAPPGIVTESNAEIEGYASATSVNIGEEIELYVNSEEPFSIRFFRIGWYDGRGARDMGHGFEYDAGIAQPDCMHFAGSHRIECRWTRPSVLRVPENWTSGVYLAKLTTLESNRQSYIIFVVRDDERVAPYLFQTSVTTYQAYNLWGGYSLYPHRNSWPKASQVSFDRPYDQGYGSEGHEGAGDFLRWEINMLRWMEREGMNVTYATNVDVHRDPALLLNRKAFLSVGHDEYWTTEMRDNVENARDQCVNLGFFSANTAYWRTRLDSNSLGDPYRVIDAPKDESCNFDPGSTTWRDDCGGAIAARPEDAMIGVMWDGPIHVDNDLVLTNTDHWVFAGSGLENGDRLIGLVGYETDRFLGNAPSSTLLLGDSPTCGTCARSGSTCPGVVTEPCYCATGGDDPESSGVSNMTIYDTDDETIVFATGTIQSSWGLDDYESSQDYTPHCSRVQPAAQDITRNVLRRMRLTPCDPPGLR